MTEHGRPCGRKWRSADGNDRVCQVPATLPHDQHRDNQWWITEDELRRRTLEQEFAHAALQLAMYHNRLDVTEYGTAAWPDLDVAGRAQYLREAKRTIGAMGLLGWAPLHPHATLYLTDEHDTLKMVRETLCAAQGAASSWWERYGDWAAESAGEHLDRLGRLIAEIDRQRPLGPDGKHGDLHTPSCGCEDR